MTEAQIKFVELESKKEEVKKYFEELDEALLAVVNEIGINKMFQDNNGIVYKTVVPTYKSVKMDHIGYSRTKRVDEKRGSLSMKEAKEAGFDL